MATPLLRGAALIRPQTTIADVQFVLDGPQRSGATLMCEQAKLSDPELLALCGNIIGSQCPEIGQLKAWRDRR